jgi:hypothetical protein
MIPKIIGWCFDMDNNYSVNMLKKAAFVDEVRNYLDIILKQAIDNKNVELANTTSIVKKYLEARIEHLTAISK